MRRLSGPRAGGAGAFGRSGASRLVAVAAGAIIALAVLGGCQARATVQDVINAVDQTRRSVEGISTAWRDELPKLVDKVQGLESQVATDEKSVVSETTNNLQDLTTHTLQLSDAVAQDLIAQAGVEFRCNANFVKAGVVAQLNHIVEDLTFWKQNGTHTSSMPIHNVCWINPTVLSLYPSGTGWSIDTSNMADGHVMHVFGYNFRADALPTLELQNANGQTLRQANVQAAYVTQYETNLDFSNENFDQVVSGARLVFRWPDQDDPNTVSLTLHPPAALRLSSPTFTPSTPTANQNAVTLGVTVSNQGGQRSGSFIVNWKPDPLDTRILSVNHLPLESGQSTQVSFPSYVYTRGGLIDSVVSLDNGDDSQSYSLTVAPPPYVPPPERDLPGFPVAEEIQYGNYAGGTGRDVEYGGDCSSGYVQSAAQVITLGTQGRASASLLGWSDPNNPQNCRIKVHYSIDASFPNPSANWVKVTIIIKERGA